MQRLRRLTLILLAAASLAGLPACGTDDAEKKANDAQEKVDKAADKAKKKAEEAKKKAEEAKKDVDGQ
jgi:hypothetical protein